MTNENTEANITVLGAPGTGKTCFLYAMASEMMKLGGCAGFTVRPEKKDETSGKWFLDKSARKDLLDKWNVIKNDLKWPLPTTDANAIARDYVFRLIGRDNRSMFLFRWVDYRGSILQEEGAEHAQLIERLSASHSVVVCLPADEIVSGGETVKDICSTYDDALMEILSPKPLCIMVCKKDLCPGAEAYKVCVDRIRTELFSKYFRRGASRVAIIPVQLGQNLQIDRGRIVGVDGKKPIIKPMNIQMPIFYSVLTSMEQRIKECDGTVAANRDGIRGVEGAGGVFSFLSKQLGVTGWRVKRCESKIADAEKEKKRLLPYIDQLKEELDNCNKKCGVGNHNVPIQIYCDGKLEDIIKE